MLSILLVAPADGKLDQLGSRNPSVEVLHARGLDEALEKLARNRRIDAVLLLCGKDNEEILEAIREDIPAAPPVFLLAGDAPLPGTHPLPAGKPEEALASLVSILETGA